MWLGRLAILTGIVNGGLGMYVAGNAGGMEIMAYSIFAALVCLAWLGAAGVGALKRHRRDVPVRRRRKGGSSDSGEVVDPEYRNVDNGRYLRPEPAVMAGGRKSRL